MTMKSTGDLKMRMSVHCFYLSLSKNSSGKDLKLILSSNGGMFSKCFAVKLAQELNCYIHGDFKSF